MDVSAFGSMMDAHFCLVKGLFTVQCSLDSFHSTREGRSDLTIYMSFPLDNSPRVSGPSGCLQKAKRRRGSWESGHRSAQATNTGFPTGLLSPAMRGQGLECRITVMAIRQPSSPREDLHGPQCVYTPWMYVYQQRHLYQHKVTINTLVRHPIGCRAC